MGQVFSGETPEATPESVGTQGGMAPKDHETVPSPSEAIIIIKEKNKPSPSPPQPKTPPTTTTPTKDGMIMPADHSVLEQSSPQLTTVDSSETTNNYFPAKAERNLGKEESFRGGLGAMPPSLTPPRPPSTTIAVPPANNDASYVTLTLADANHLHASWSNTNHEDLLGLSTSVPFHAKAYESANLSVERPLPVSRVASSQSRVSSIGDANGNSSVIHDAARITNWETVKELCENEPEAARFVGRDRWTALHHACNRRCPYPDVVEALIRAYPDALLLEEDKGWLPLHYACRFKCTKEVVRLLLQPEKGRTAVSMLDRQGRTPLYYAVRYDAPPGVVGLLLEVDATAVLEEDQNADSPLALVWDAWAEKLDGKRTLQRIYGPIREAAEMTSEDRAKRVWKRLQTQLKVLEQWNKVNMFLKAAFGFSVDDDLEVVDNHIHEEKKDAPGSPKVANERKWRILHATGAIKCHPSLFLLAIALHPEQAFELDNKDLKGPSHVCGGCQSASGLTVLHFAASSQASGESGRLVINQLITLNPNAAQAVDSDGCLPLHAVAANKSKRQWSVDGIKEIFLAYTRAVRSPDLQGRLPLHRAAASITHEGGSNEETMEQSVICNLLEEHRDAACHADYFGRLPLHNVAEHGESWDAQVQVLYDAFPAAARARTGVKLGNKLPLHMAASNPMVQFSLISHLVQGHPRGASQSDRQGKSPLHYACETGLSWESIKAIHEAFPEAVRQSEQNSRGWTPLHMAAACPEASLELLSNLIELCPESAAIADSRGRYPLHLACLAGKGWDYGLSTLFDASPDAIRCPDNVGLLPFHIATFRYSMSSSKEVVKRPIALDATHRRFSTSASVEAMQQATAKDGEDGKRIEILFHLLKADPTVLNSF